MSHTKPHLALFHSATPQKMGRASTTTQIKANEEQTLFKDLLSPLGKSLSALSFTSNTPFKVQPELLKSPMPVQKDLFSQLLSTDNKSWGYAQNMHAEDSIH